MSNTPVVLSERIGMIVEPVHEAFELSRERFSRYPGLYREQDQLWVRTHLMRAFLWQHFSDNPLPTPWSLTGNHRQNGPVNIAYGSGEMKAKFVHAFPVGQAPPAGHNGARRAYYTNHALAEMSDPDHMLTHNLLLTWEEPGPEVPFELTVIRPLSAGSLYSRVKADVFLPLPRAATLFEDLEFDTLDDDEMLELHIDDSDLGDASDGS